MSDDTATPQTVTLTIDGKEITVPAGTLIIRAAERMGNIIPRFCDHPLLDPVGACRQCIVEVEGQRKPMMSCTTTATEGMVVKTHLTSEVARKGQEGTLEFLLINHPLDCPMCDKGGECPLQDQALTHGANVSRFVDDKRRYQKPVAVSAQVLLDRERCVLCARCTRFSEQISGDPFIELFERGALEQVAIYEDEPYQSYFSGNVIQICPVGALTSADYRFKARPFDIRSAPAVCNNCSAGCTLTVQSRRGEIQRQLARTNMAVNEAWNCDKGRFGYPILTSDLRIRGPRMREGGELVEAPWSQALLAATRGIQEAQEAGKGVAIVTGSRIADEDAYAVSKYARTVLRTDDVEFRTRFAPEGETEAVAAMIGRDTATYADVEAAPIIFTVGLDPEEEVPILHLRIRKAWRNHKARIVPVGARMGSMAEFAWRRLATAPGGETGALAALGSALGIGDLDDAATTSAYSSDALETVAEALRDSADAVLLVGERAPAGALAAAGRIADHVGGKVAWVPRRAGARGAFDAGLAPGSLPGGRRLDDDGDRRAVTDLWGEVPAERGRDLRAILEATVAGDIEVLHLIGVDLVRDCDSPALAAEALAAADLVIAQDLALSDTVAEHADIVLPVTGSQERNGTYTNWEGRSQRSQLGVNGPDAVQDDWEIVRQLAALLGHDLGFNDLASLRAEAEKLGTRAVARDWPAVTAEPVASPEEGLAPISYPLLLDKGTMLHGADALLLTAPPPRIVMHPADAERLGLSEGELVTVSAGDHELELPLAVDDEVVAGAVFVPANSTETTGRSLEGPGVTVRRSQPAEVSA